MTPNSIRREIDAEAAKPDGERDEARLSVLRTVLAELKAQEAAGEPLWEPEPVGTVSDLRTQMEKAERLGYGDWRVRVYPRFEPDPERGSRHLLRCDREYEICGVNDPDTGDGDAGVLYLEIEEKSLAVVAG